MKLKLTRIQEAAFELQIGAHGLRNLVEGGLVELEPKLTSLQGIVASMDNILNNPFTCHGMLTDLRNHVACMPDPDKALTVATQRTQAIIAHLEHDLKQSLNTSYRQALTHALDYLKGRK